MFFMLCIELISLENIRFLPPELIFIRSLFPPSWSIAKPGISRGRAKHDNTPCNTSDKCHRKLLFLVILGRSWVIPDVSGSFWLIPGHSGWFLVLVTTKKPANLLDSMFIGKHFMYSLYIITRFHTVVQLHLS